MSSFRSPTPPPWRHTPAIRPDHRLHPVGHGRTRRHQHYDEPGLHLHRNGIDAGQRELRHQRKYAAHQRSKRDHDDRNADSARRRSRALDVTATGGAGSGGINVTVNGDILSSAGRAIVLDQNDADATGNVVLTSTAGNTITSRRHRGHHPGRRFWHHHGRS